MNAPVAARVYRDIVSPLVLGGVVRPGRPLGGDAIARLFLQADAVDADLRSRTDLGRVQVARSLVPIDLLPEASAGDWCLFGCVHDWLAAASPELTTLYPRRPAERLLEMMAAALALVAPPKDVLAALSRHTYLSRLFELHRKDVRVSFWAGSRVFLGTKPPERLFAWPSVRRVTSETFERELAALPEHGGHVDKERWLELLEQMLRSSPLTDLATLTRGAPDFKWSRESLGLASTEFGRRLVVRSLRAQRTDAVLRAVGRATRLLLLGEAFRAVAVAVDVLQDLLLAYAVDASPHDWQVLVADAGRSKDLFFGLALGSLAAEEAASKGLSSHDAEVALARLLPIARSEEARALIPAGATAP